MTQSEPIGYDIREYGATSDATATDAIQTALDDCAESGGTVHIPPARTDQHRSM
jgi:polygalacturonase